MAYTDELIAGLKAGKENARKPIRVDIPIVGPVYIRLRTVREFEQMADKSGKDRPGGLFGANTADVLCDPDGERLPKEQAEQIAELIAENADVVFRKIQAAANGESPGLGKLTRRQEFIMDLALELGLTVERLEREMTERELRQWIVYANRKRLPMRRVELMLARIAQMQSSGKDTLDKFLMFERPPEPVPDDEPEPLTRQQAGKELAAMVGSNVRFIDLRAVKRPPGYEIPEGQNDGR